jgi:hypothetical protein
MTIRGPADWRCTRRSAGRPNPPEPPRAGRTETCRQWVLAGFVLAIATLHAPTLAAQVLITGLSDLDLGTWNGVSDLQGEDQHCVYGGQAGRYSIEATGDGPGNAFALQNGPFSLPYQVTYNDGTGWSDMAPGRPLPGQRGAPNLIQWLRCVLGRREPESVRVRVLAQDLSAAIAGGYSGTLTLLVAPE